MSDIPTYTLAIETATQKGSISLLKGREEIGSWVGGNYQTLSSNLLPQISRILSENNVTLSDIDLIAVSAGPGSFTGIRVGMSAAKALSTALKRRAIAVPLTEALALGAGPSIDNLITLIPSGRTEVYWQEFSRASEIVPVSPIASVKVEDPPIPRGKDFTLIGTSDMKPEYVASIEARAGKQMITATDGLAKYIGMAAIGKYVKKDSGGSLVPVYIKEFHA